MTTVLATLHVGATNHVDGTESTQSRPAKWDDRLLAPMYHWRGCSKTLAEGRACRWCCEAPCGLTGLSMVCLHGEDAGSEEVGAAGMQDVLNEWLGS